MVKETCELTPPRGPVAAIGNFDGVHVGHQQLLAQTTRFADELGVAPNVVVFDPHPRIFFRPDDPPFFITTPEMRDELLRMHGATEILSLRFDSALASLSPESFVHDVLVGDLHLSGVIVGEEFHFGRGREGDASALMRLGAEAGLAVRLITPKRATPDVDKIGSSGIRSAIRAGDLMAAARMLGRPWAARGIVQEGQKLGRTMGFPTANLSMGLLLEPRRGVYCVRVTLRGKEHLGVANFGRRPTVGAQAVLLEAHLFDFDCDIYGETIEVAFFDFIREERKFESLDALKAQIAIDCAAARALLTGSRQT